MKNNPNGCEAKPKPKTRDQLIAEVAVLDELIKVVALENDDRRRDLSELLDSFDIYKEEYGSRRESRSVKVLSWNGIIFKIGELKADADFSKLSEELARDKKFIEDLQQRIFLFEHPDRKDKPCECRQCLEHRGMPRY